MWCRPLEGFWWSESGVVDYRDKGAFQWISAIRLPDFVGEEDFRWAVEEASRKKKLDCSGAFFYHLEEGLCVQMMHLGPYDSEPASLEAMDAFAREKRVRARHFRNPPPSRDLSFRPAKVPAREVEDGPAPPHPQSVKTPSRVWREGVSYVTGFTGCSVPRTAANSCTATAPARQWPR